MSRRYKHFDWLHERLEAKYACVPVPPLPDKQVTGKKFCVVVFGVYIYIYIQLTSITNFYLKGLAHVGHFVWGVCVLC